MSLEVATLTVRPGQEEAFETALRGARKLIASTPGFGGLEIRRCVETPNRYLLLVCWRALEDHTVGFRQGPNYAEWRRRLHHFYEPAPTVEHYADPLAL